MWINNDIYKVGMVNIQWKFLSGSGLKLIAMIAMIVDHLAAFLFYNNPLFVEPLFDIYHKQITLYFIFRAIGRIAFPIFAFLLVEGFSHTHNVKKYLTNLLVFAIVSELPWNLLHGGYLCCIGSQNVFFTLFLGCCGMYAIKYVDDIRKRAYMLIGLLIISIFLRADYGISGYGFILMIYVLRDNALIQAVVGSCMLSSRWMAGLAFIPINMYNGNRGFIQGKYMKYIFYVFYPLHLMIIYILRFL